MCISHICIQKGHPREKGEREFLTLILYSVYYILALLHGREAAVKSAASLLSDGCMCFIIDIREKAAPLRVRLSKIQIFSLGLTMHGLT